MKNLFEDYEERDELQEKFHKNMQEILSDNCSIKELEKLLVMSQQLIITLINKLLHMKSLKEVKELSNAFDYIVNSMNNNESRPLRSINKYIDLCDVAGLIVGECEESEMYCERQIIKMQEKWYKESEDLSGEEGIICEYAFNIFGQYYYFLNYFAFEQNQLTYERIRNLCISQIDTILFEILWSIDEECHNSYESSKFNKAFSEIVKKITQIRG